MNTKEQLFYGPSHHSDNKVYVVNFSADLIKNDVSAKDLQLLYKVIPQNYIRVMDFTDVGKDVLSGSELLVYLIDKLMRMKCAHNHQIVCDITDEGHYQLVLGYDNETVAFMSAHIAYLLMNLIYTNVGNAQVNSLPHKFDKLYTHLPSEIVKGMFDAAISLNIPFYEVKSSPGNYSYGQGNRSLVYNHSSNNHDSIFGYFLAQNKLATAIHLKNLGYPANDILSVNNVDQCLAASRKLGFPLVIKPIDAQRGKGITANIQSEQEIANAFQAAAGHSPTVLVERYLEGVTYRLTVSQGKINTIYAMHRAHVVGDGINDIKTLISIENDKRKNEWAPGRQFEPLKLDENSFMELAKSGLKPESILKKGTKGYLRSVSNTAAGGTYEIISPEQLHPDVISMAIEVANTFRLDNAGIDYITRDISKSWRKHGTIIEVNSFPSIGETTAKQMFQSHFPESHMARIRTVLVIGDDNEIAKNYYLDELKKSPYMAFVSKNDALLNGEPMKLELMSVEKKCESFLVNPNCSGLVVSSTLKELKENGLPIEYIDLCILDENSDDSFQKWINKFTDKVEKKV